MRRMPMPRRLVAGQRAQPVVEIVRAEVEGAVQELAVALQARRSPSLRVAIGHALHQRRVVDHLAPDDAGLAPAA